MTTALQHVIDMQPEPAVLAFPVIWVVMVRAVALSECASAHGRTRMMCAATCAALKTILKK